MLSEISSWLLVSGRPFVICADWNMEHQELSSTGIERKLGARVVAPRYDFTCQVGQRKIDYFLVSEAVVPFFECGRDE
eukprot:6957388-Karenia_brevis.AAC.1